MSVFNFFSSSFNFVNFCLFIFKAKDVFSQLRTLILDSNMVDEAFKPPDKTILK